MDIDNLIKAWQTTKKIKGHATDKTIEGYSSSIENFWHSGLSFEKYIASIDPENRTHNRDKSVINEFLYWAQVNGFLKKGLKAFKLPRNWTSKYQLDLPPSPQL